MDITSELSRSLKEYLPWNKCRIDCFSKMVVALLTVRTVNLTQWACVFKTKATVDSAYMRIKRFFRYFKFNGDEFARFVFHLFCFYDTQWYITIDRTNWQLGQHKINFFVLAIAYKGVAIPVMWTLLNKKGGTSSQERISLMDRFIFCFGKSNILGVLADREFISEEWFSYLKNNEIPFYIRIRWDLLVGNSKGKPVNAWTLFLGLKKYEARVLKGKRRLFGMEFNFAGTRCEDGDFFIIATTESAHNAIEIYARRWQIETLFGCLKTQGFNFEDTSLTKPERLEKLMAILTIAFCWAHKIGEWNNKIKPIKLKKHGRKAVSLFRSGADKLRHIFSQSTKMKAEINNLIQQLMGPPPLINSPPAKVGI